MNEIVKPSFAPGIVEETDTYVCLNNLVDNCVIIFSFSRGLKVFFFHAKYP